jgi:hypothetical protein
MRNDPFFKDFDRNFQKSKKQFEVFNNLVKVGILFGFLAIGAVVVVNVFNSASGNASNSARNSARIWIQQMYPNEEGNVVCQNVDTDGNGYVSCSIRVGNRAPMALECSPFSSLNAGCRIPVIQQLRYNQ